MSHSRGFGIVHSSPGIPPIFTRSLHLEPLQTPHYMIVGSQTSLRLTICFSQYVIDNLGLQIIFVKARIVHGQLLVRLLGLKLAHYQ